VSRSSIVVVAALALVSVSSAFGTVRRPTLKLDSGPPAVLKGSNFTPRSVVRIFVTGQRATTFKVRATARGTFSLAVPYTTSKCNSLIVQAIGVSGERASWGIGTACGEIGGLGLPGVGA
jgi:hypothetical protein